MVEYIEDHSKIVSNAVYLIFYVRKDISIQKKNGVEISAILN